MWWKEALQAYQGVQDGGKLCVVGNWRSALATCVGNQNGSRFTQICLLWKEVIDDEGTNEGG